MPGFNDDRRWRNLLMILDRRSFTVKIVAGATSEGVFVRRFGYPQFEVWTTSSTPAADFLVEIQGHQHLGDVTEAMLDEFDDDEDSG